MDGRGAAFSDTGAVTPAVAPAGVVRRINEVAPLAGNWQAPTDPERPRRATAQELRFEMVGSTTPGQDVVRNTGPVLALDNSTLAVSFLMRDGFGGPNMGICMSPTPNWGVVGGGGAIQAFINGSLSAFSALTVPRAQKCSLVVRFTSTQARASLLTGGVTTSDAIVGAITGGSTATTGLFMANGIGASQGMYGSIGQLLAIGRAVSDTERDGLLSFMDTLPLAPGYPLDKALVGIIGDSIARGATSVNTSASWWGLMLPNIRGTSPGVEVCNAAIGGSGVGLSAYSAVMPSVYSAARSKNVLIIATGTNDLAVGNGSAFTIAGYFALCDAARAAGWKVVACTVLPRSASLSISQGTFNTDRATVNAAIIAGTSHFDAIARVDLVAGMGADGDSANATNYGDQVHPTAIGHGLIEPTYRAATISLL